MLLDYRQIYSRCFTFRPESSLEDLHFTRLCFPPEKPDLVLCWGIYTTKDLGFPLFLYNSFYLSLLFLYFLGFELHAAWGVNGSPFWVFTRSHTEYSLLHFKYTRMKIHFVSTQFILVRNAFADDKKLQQPEVHSYNANNTDVKTPQRKAPSWIWSGGANPNTTMLPMHHSKYPNTVPSGILSSHLAWSEVE